MTRLPLFAHHPRSWQENLYVYPVISRRSRGLSIGVNLNPDKACNFDCVYCCVDRSKAPTVREVDLDTLNQELELMVELAETGEIFRHQPFDQTPPELQRINDIAFSGDGEPTSFPGFGEACKIAGDTLRRHGLSDVKLVVITNATLLQRPAVVEALAYLDAHQGEIWAKLEAGTDAYYKQIERTTIPLQRVIDNIAHAGQSRDLVIQSLFMRIHGEPPPQAEVDAYVDRLRELQDRGTRIRLVQVYTVARWTAEKYVEPLLQGELDAIADRVRALGLAAEPFA